MLTSHVDNEIFSISGDSDNYYTDCSDEETGKGGMGKEENIIDPKFSMSTPATTKEQLFMRKENYIYFLSETGEPCDDGSRVLAKRHAMPQFKKTEIGNINIAKTNNKHHLAMIIRDRDGSLIDKRIFSTMCQQLVNVILNTGLRSISMAKTTEINGMQRNFILQNLAKKFC